MLGASVSALPAPAVVADRALDAADRALDRAPHPVALAEELLVVVLVVLRALERVAQHPPDRAPLLGVVVAELLLSQSSSVAMARITN